MIYHNIYIYINIWYKTKRNTSNVASRAPTLALHTIGAFDELDVATRTRYSLMKHGDQIAANSLAVDLARLIMQSVEDRNLLLTSVPNPNPIPVQAVIDHIFLLLLFGDFMVDTYSIDLEDSSPPLEKNYGTLTQAERVKSTASKRLFLPEEKAPLLRGRSALLIDDLRVTGNTEAYCERHLASCPVASYGFAYLVRFTEELATTKPETEEELNRATVKTVTDLLPTVATGWTINERAARFILNLKPEPKIHDLNERDKTHALLDFLHTIPLPTLVELSQFTHRPAFRYPHYQKALELIEQVTQERVRVFRTTGVAV